MKRKIDYEEEIIGNNKNIIATITHDLKTPALAQIRALEFLLKGNLGEIPDIQKNFLTEILNSSKNMLYMLINMLWLYKFDNKQIAINISEFDINEVIKEVFEENRLILNSKNQKFELYLNSDYKIISADRMHIKRIITNLILNAYYHSKENTNISINTEIYKDDFVFKVTNPGQYLPEENLQFIFDKNKVFTQESNGLSTGLGLYLSNSLLKLNKGKFIFNSKKDGTNTFGFMLKLPVKNVIKDKV